MGIIYPIAVSIHLAFKESLQHRERQRFSEAPGTSEQRRLPAILYYILDQRGLVDKVAVFINHIFVKFISDSNFFI